jgi:hypothetical protein
MTTSIYNNFSLVFMKGMQEVAIKRLRKDSQQGTDRAASLIKKKGDYKGWGLSLP